MRARKLRVLLSLAVLLLLLPAPATPTRAEEESPDDRAKALYGAYMLERRDPSWGAFQRRLTALRQLGPIACDLARKSLLKVAKSGKALDDRILASIGIARHGDLAAVRQLVAILAKKGHPVLTQAVGEALAETKDGEVLTWLSDEALSLPESSLALILRAHASLPTPEAAPRLVDAYGKWEASPAAIDLAFDAVQALGRGTAPEALPVLREAAVHTDPRLRLAAADGIARQDPAEVGVVETVKLLLADPQPSVQRAMAVGIESAKREAFVPQITVLLESDDPRTVKAALDVLKRMTKKDFGVDAGAWRRWWEQRDLPDAPTPYTVPSYHGLPVFTERVVFVLDRSGSMLWPHAPGESTRMEVAQDALVDVLGKFTPRTVFNVLSFDSKVLAWRKGEAVADPKNVAKAVRWVEKQESERGAFTNTYGVLEKAYAENPVIDTIYLLSDGIPEDGEVTTSEGLLAAVRGWNRYRRVQIHAIALTLMYLHPGKYPITSSMRRAEDFMKDLARIGGGSSKHVARPPPK